MSRLLFCFFAEDTGIFDQGIFTNSISSYTQLDGSDLNSFFGTLFEVLNIEVKERYNYPEYLNKFPYVNGGLFRKKHTNLKFSLKIRKMIIDSGTLDWSEINPDIFGSMIQAVVHPDQRGGLGMHYTSVPNIMKVIEPLFLNELREEFQINYNQSKNLEKLLVKLENICFFDPACGSGNFLIIA
ncbi:TPA: class I SAM-dependent DNA methyltransferase, partial [Legionella pneumophila]|nr:class I SAM-dependent DNA methyltransferase [Legionella pneumophila]